MPDYTGHILRIPGGGSTFVGKLPRFSQRSSYVTAMATVGETPTSTFDPNAFAITRLVTTSCPPCLQLVFTMTSSSSVTLGGMDSCPAGSGLFPPIGSTGPNGILIPNVVGGAVRFPSSYRHIVTFRSENMDYRQYHITTDVLTPGTLLPGNQWYCNTSWTAVGMACGIVNIGSPAPGSCTVQAGVYLVDFHAGLTATPTVTLISTLDSWSLSSGIGSHTISAGSIHQALGTTLPSQFVICFGVISTAVSISAPGSGQIEAFVQLDDMMTCEPGVAWASDFTTTIVQAP